MWARTWKVSAPVYVAGLAQVALTLVDTLLLARFSTQALAAIALAAPVFLVVSMVGRGWGNGIQILVARRYGAGDEEDVGRFTDVGLMVGVTVGTVLGMSLALAAPVILGILGSDQGVLRLAVDYLRIIAVALPFFLATAALQGAYVGLGQTGVVMRMVLLTNAVHLPLGMLLIFGLELGVVGAAIATTVSQIVGTSYIWWYGRQRFAHTFGLLRRENLVQWRQPAHRLWDVAWPEITTLGAGYFNELVLVGIVAQLGFISLAAHRVIDNITLVAITGIAAAGTGTTVLVAQRLGAGDLNGVFTHQRAGIIMACVLAALPVLPLIFAPHLALGMFTSDPSVRDVGAAAATTVVVSLAPIVLSIGLSAPLRAAGDTRSNMIASLIGDYLVLLPGAWFLGLKFDFGLRGVYLAWILQGSVYLVVLYLRYRGGRWQTTTT